MFCELFEIDHNDDYHTITAVLPSSRALRVKSEYRIAIGTHYYKSTFRKTSGRGKRGREGCNGRAAVGGI